MSEPGDGAEAMPHTYMDVLRPLMVIGMQEVR